MFFKNKCRFLLIFVVESAISITLKKECPSNEVHRSCAFYNENTCWLQADRMERVKTPPKKLTHCKTGCFCKKSLVREYPGGPCIVAASCRNRKLQALLKSLPTEQVAYFKPVVKDLYCKPCQQEPQATLPRPPAKKVT